ncbi:hypothetical protein Ndes2437A_g05397 [Nannochloris sp. 'desiccata']
MSASFLRAIEKLDPSVLARFEKKVDEDEKFTMEAALKFKGSEEDLKETLAGLEKLFEDLKKLPKKPVIVLDEANKIMKWLGWLAGNGLTEDNCSVSPCRILLKNNL